LFRAAHSRRRPATQKSFTIEYAENERRNGRRSLTGS